MYNEFELLFIVGQIRKAQQNLENSCIVFKGGELIRLLYEGDDWELNTQTSL